MILTKCNVQHLLINTKHWTQLSLMVMLIVKYWTKIFNRVMVNHHRFILWGTWMSTLFTKLHYSSSNNCPDISLIKLKCQPWSGAQGKLRRSPEPLQDSASGSNEYLCTKWQYSQISSYGCDWIWFVSQLCHKMSVFSVLDYIWLEWLLD